MVAGKLPSGLRWRTVGTGDPVTLVVPGLGATDGEARIPASGLPGSRVVLTLPGHGDAPDAAPGYWRYRVLAEQVRQVADQVRATRAVGVSLGAAALLRLLAEHPAQFDRVALLLPAALDQPRRRHGTFGALAAAVHEPDPAALRELVAAGLPAGAHVGSYVDQRTAALTRLGPAFTDLADDAPVPDRTALAAVHIPVLVIAAAHDPLHPAEVAAQVAAALPNARLENVRLGRPPHHPPPPPPHPPAPVPLTSTRRVPRPDTACPTFRHGEFHVQAWCVRGWCGSTGPIRVAQRGHDGCRAHVLLPATAPGHLCAHWTVGVQGGASHRAATPQAPLTPTVQCPQTPGPG